MYSSTEAAAAGFIGLVAGAFVTVAFFAVIWYILSVIAWWKIFTKAGEAGWKALIPIYNMWTAYKVSGLAPWWALLPMVTGAITTIFADERGNMPAFIGFVVMVLGIMGFVLTIMYRWKLAKAFKKDTGFAILTVIFPNIMGLVLGFGNAKYDKKAAYKK